MRWLNVGSDKYGNNIVHFFLRDEIKVQFSYLNNNFPLTGLVFVDFNIIPVGTYAKLCFQVMSHKQDVL